MNLLLNLRHIVAALLPQPVRYVQGHFTWQGETGVWVPAYLPEGPFPVVMADVQRLRLAPDLRSLRHELALLYAEPHAPDRSDVPLVHHRAAGTLLQLLLGLAADANLELSTEPALAFFQQAGPMRLAGANAALELEGPLSADFCC